MVFLVFNICFLIKFSSLSLSSLSLSLPVLNWLIKNVRYTENIDLVLFDHNNYLLSYKLVWLFVCVVHIVFMIAPNIDYKGTFIRN